MNNWPQIGISTFNIKVLINMSVDYVVKFGLRFNPSKTVCMIGGQNPFLSIPVWTINDVHLAVSDNVKYLGSTPSSANSSVHINGRIKAAQYAFYAQ